jgi:hypothetical protein
MGGQTRADSFSERRKKPELLLGSRLRKRGEQRRLSRTNHSMAMYRYLLRSTHTLGLGDVNDRGMTLRYGERETRTFLESAARRGCPLGRRRRDLSREKKGGAGLFRSSRLLGRTVDALRRPPAALFLPSTSCVRTRAGGKRGKSAIRERRLAGGTVSPSASNCLRLS